MATATLPTNVQHRHEFVCLFDVKNGNPNGDPDAGNAPRVDPETGRGLITDVCIKRKIRNFICLAKTDTDGNPEQGYDIYVKEKAILNNQHQRAYEALGLNDKDKKTTTDPDGKARAWMCQNFFDIRMFGAVMTTKVNCGQVRGPVQLAFSLSVDPIISLEQSITRMAVTTENESKSQEGGNRTMGRKEIVPYGLYRMHGFFSPHLAADTGFSSADLELLWQALQMMFEHDRSAARGEMAVRKLIVFEHDSMLGNAPAHALFNRITLERKAPEMPARDYSDYKVEIDEKNLPKGVTLHELL